MARLFLLALLTAGCGEDQPATRGLVLPDGTARLRIEQRGSEPVPGSAGRLHVHLGDITRGQVAITISHADGRVVLATTSLAEGATRSFAFDGERYRVTLHDLQNRLLGEDYAVLEFGMRPSERERIEALLAAIERADVALIRNGEVHSAAKAIAHLRRKWKHVGGELTAEQFIDAIASRSSTTGRPYLIKRREGPVEAAVWFREQLRALDDGQ